MSLVMQYMQTFFVVGLLFFTYAASGGPHAGVFAIMGFITLTLHLSLKTKSLVIEFRKGNQDRFLVFCHYFSALSLDFGAWLLSFLGSKQSAEMWCIYFALGGNFLVLHVGLVLLLHYLQKSQCR